MAARNRPLLKSINRSRRILGIKALWCLLPLSFLTTGKAWSSMKSPATLPIPPENSSSTAPRYTDTISILDFNAETSAADNYAAIQAALDSGKHVYIPDGEYSVSNTLLIRHSGQKVFGSGSIVMSKGEVKNVFIAEGVNNITFDGVTVIAGGGIGSIYHTCCIKLVQCNYPTVNGCTLSGHIGGAVQLVNSHYAVINNNQIGAAGDAGQEDAFSIDIAVYFSGDGHHIRGNRCLGQGGYGIVVQTLNDSPADFDRIDNTLISENMIGKHSCYGIMMYRGKQRSQVVGSVVSTNIIDGITGSRKNPAKGDNSFGAGIYLQGAEGISVTANNIRNCNQQTTSELLAPAGIGISNSKRVTVVGNIIEDCHYHGIDVNDSNHDGSVIGGISISGNMLRNIQKTGVRIVTASNILISNNTLDTCEHGIYVSSQKSKTPCEDVVIASNIVKNTRVNGLYAMFSLGCIISLNRVDNCGGSGIVLFSSGNTKIAENILSFAAVRGVDIDATCFGLNVVSGNMVTDSHTAFHFAAKTQSVNNLSSNSKLEYSGAFATGNPPG